MSHHEDRIHPEALNVTPLSDGFFLVTGPQASAVVMSRDGVRETVRRFSAALAMQAEGGYPRAVDLAS